MHHLVKVRKLLMSNQSLFIGKLPPTEQARQLGPVCILLLAVASIKVCAPLLRIAVSTIGSYKPTLDITLI